MRRTAASALCVALVLSLAPAVMAGGYELGTDNGAEAVGRAGATTANPSFTALYTNVAGLADVDYVELYLSNNFNFRHVWFQRMGVGQEWAPVEDERGMAVGPMLGLHFRVADWLVLGIGANGPAAIAGGDFPSGSVEADADGTLTGASRFDLTHSEVLYIWPSIAAGIRFPGFPNLRIGISFQPAFAFLWFTSYAENATAARTVVGDEARNDLFVEDSFVPGGQLGFLYRVNGFERLEFGLQFRFSDSIDAEGEATAYVHAREDNEERRPRCYDVVVDGETVERCTTARFQAPIPPLVMRFGVRYAHPRAGAPENAVYNFERELFDIELDLVYEMNSHMDGYRVSIRDINLYEEPGFQIIIPEVKVFLAHNWRDTVSLRLGGTVNLLRGHLSISAGFSWESNTQPEETTRLDYLPWMRFGLGIGVVGRISIVEIALSYQHIFMPDRTVENGEVVAPVATANEEQTLSDTVVNNGDYEASYDIIGFSLGFRFDRPNRSRGDEEEEPIEETVDTEPIEDEEPYEGEEVLGEEVMEVPEDEPPAEEPAAEEPPVDDEPEQEPAEEMPIEAV